MTLTNEDIELSKKLKNIADNGFYADSKTVTDLYNKVLQKHEPNTNCGSCIKRRIYAVWAIVEQALKAIEVKNEPQQEEKPQEEANPAQTETNNKKVAKRKITKK